MGKTQISPNLSLFETHTTHKHDTPNPTHHSTHPTTHTQYTTYLTIHSTYSLRRLVLLAAMS